MIIGFDYEAEVGSALAAAMALYFAELSRSQFLSLGPSAAKQAAFYIAQAALPGVGTGGVQAVP